MLAKTALLILVISNIVTLLIGLVAYRKNPESATNRLFGLLSLALIGWSSASYLSNLGDSVSAEAFMFTRIAFVFTGLQNLFFLLLIHTFPSTRLLMKRFSVVIVVGFGLVVACLPLSGPFFAADMHGMLMPGPGMLLLMVSLVIFAIAGITLLVRKLHRLSGPAKNQSRFLIVAAIILWGLVPLSVGVLPILLNLGFAFAVSPLIALLFAMTLAYAVIRQRLFDIRPVAARSLSYGLFLVALVVAYMAVAFGISSLFGKK